ncbi:MAG: iron-containing alcohol dehydrogenase [Spirochaetales bacterium]|nr:iron-containing alcohol dehydrogenase [Spirochaetales bacterium]
MVDFSFAANRKIIFGRNKTLSLAGVLNHGPILAVTGQNVSRSENWNSLKQEIEKKGLPLIHKILSGEPSPDDVDALCRETVSEHPAAVLALGGGSVLDAGKAVSAMLCEPAVAEGIASVQDFLEGVGTREPSGARLPLYAVPTTAGTGSECTKNAVISRPGADGFKKSLRHDNYIPDLAVIDSAWLNSLPQKTAASCGMDAFSQLLESYLSTASSPFTDALALEGLIRFSESFSTLLDGKASDADYDNIALGACISGLTLANAGLGTVHGIAGTLGGLGALPHGTACGLLLPPVMKSTFGKLLAGDKQNEALLKVQRLMNRDGKGLSVYESVEQLVDQLQTWSEQADLPGLGSFGFSPELLKKAAETSGDKNNPCPFTPDERLEFLHEIY